MTEDSAATGAGDELIAYLSDPPHGGNRYIGSHYSVEQMKKAAAALRAKDAEIERLTNEVARLTQKLACVSRMKVFPDDKTNRFTLAAAITLATNAIALKEQDQ